MNSFFICFFFFYMIFSFTNALNLWCKTTPYPNICQQDGLDSKNLSEFKKFAIKTAMRKAQSEINHIIWLGENSINKKEKAILANCLELYENAIFHLNKTFTDCNNFDIQTWVSATLTNLETCRDGLFHLKTIDHVHSFMSNNVTEFIRHCLSINSALSSLPETYHAKDGFPEWIKGDDQKFLQSPSPRSNIVVAQDGSGNYTTIQDALNAAKVGNGRFIIYIKKGIYKEYLVIGKDMINLMMVGDGRRYTIISGRRSEGGGFETFDSATVVVEGQGFIARGITFRNTAGPHNHQAVALRSGSDKSVFFCCGFEGYQDTLYVHKNRQFYKECYIYGTVDFIFGNAIVVLQNCIIYVRKPLPGQHCVITAQGRDEPDDTTGISIHNSRIMAAADLIPVQNSVRVYLGRPWRKYSRTVYLENFIDRLVDPAGWLEYRGDYALNTLYYGEYNNFGPGSSTGSRVRWKGYRVIRSEKEASKFSVEKFIEGKLWLPGTGVPFTPGV